MNEGERYLQLRFERMRVGTQAVIPREIAGMHLDAELVTEHHLNALLMRVRGYVTAGVRREEPYTLSDTVISTEMVPKRPVRDGALIWLSEHLPERLSGRVRPYIQWREITTRTLAKMQEVTYYGCPHVGFNVPRDEHLVWMAEQSGQIPPSPDSSLDATRTPADS